MDTAHPITLLLVALGLALVPAILGAATSYLKVSIVLGMIKSALGTQQVPGPLVTMSLSLALTCHVMAPVFSASLEAASDVDLQKVVMQKNLRGFSALVPVLRPWHEFLVKHSGARELRYATALSDGESSNTSPAQTASTPSDARQLSEPAKSLPDTKPVPSASREVDQSNAPSAKVEDAHDLPPWRVALLAFILSELKEAFAMGFVLLLPFLVIDLVIANILVGLGMFMVSPVLVALPVKLLLFVLADGWIFIVRGLVESYQIP